MVNRRGATTTGCLFVLLIFAVAGYVGMEVGQPYYRFYQFKDAAEQEARFAALRSDGAIKKNLYAAADSLGLPEDAYHLNIVRGVNAVRIQTSYDDEWAIASYRRSVHFDIDVEGSI